jgi:hypothetical protein
MNGLRQSICLIFCHYYLSKSELQEAVKRLLNSSSFFVKTLIVVHNGDQKGDQLASLGGSSTNVRQVDGTNRLFDFSAYVEGLEALTDEERQSGVLFINDSAYIKLPANWILKKIGEDCGFALKIDVPCIVGFGATYQFFLQINPWSDTPKYICSACFFANSMAIMLLKSLFLEGITALNRGLNFPTSVDEVVEALVGRKFHCYLQLLLFTPTGGAWSPRAEVAHLPDMQLRKAICFYLEHRLSAVVQINDGGLIFINRGISRVNFTLRLYFAQVIWKIKLNNQRRFRIFNFRY